MSGPGRVAQSVTCLATDACLTAIPGVASSIPARSHTFVEIDHEIISTVILLPSADSFKKGCCQLQAKVCARITGYPLVQACPGKSVVRWTDRPAMTIAVDLGRKATKPTNQPKCLRVVASFKITLFIISGGCTSGICLWDIRRVDFVGLKSTSQSIIGQDIDSFEIRIKNKSCSLHPLYPMIQPNFYIEELIQNTTSRARMDSSKLTMFWCLQAI